MIAHRFPDCTLALVAGGRGLRLGGTVKANLLLPDGRTLLRRTLDVLGPCCDGILVAADDPGPFAGLRVVPDAVPGRGAPGGVQSACAAAGTGWVLAVGSDLPFADPAVLDLLWRRRAGTDAVAATLFRGRPEPLLAFYQAGPCAAAFGAALRAGPVSFAELFATVRAELVPAAELRAVDPELRSFTNLNTPEALAAAGVRLPDR
jgi:molybdopterin-guanine dinucleotide biosynthesis protein A